MAISLSVSFLLFNDTLNTFYLRLYGVRHMVKDHSDSERGNPLPPHGLLFSISLSEWSFTICSTPYNRKLTVLSASLNKTFPSFEPNHVVSFRAGKNPSQLRANDPWSLGTPSCVVDELIIISSLAAYHTVWENTAIVNRFLLKGHASRRRFSDEYFKTTKNCAPKVFSCFG